MEYAANQHCNYTKTICHLKVSDYKPIFTSVQ